MKMTLKHIMGIICVGKKGKGVKTQPTTKQASTTTTTTQKKQKTPQNTRTQKVCA